MRAIRSGSATKYDGRPPVESQGRLRVSRHMNLISIGVLVTSLVAGTGLAADSQVIDLSRSRLVDLTHAYNAQTIYWPTAPTRFSLEKLAYGPAPGGYFYCLVQLLDTGARRHAPRRAAALLRARPIHRPGAARSADRAGRRHRRVVAERRPIRTTACRRTTCGRSSGSMGRFAPGTIVLLRTGWSRRWPDVKAYLGDDTPGDASKLRFPSYGEDAARLLVEERRVGALGVDTASIDYGRSTDFMVHRVAAARQVAGLENLTNLDQVPATGATLIALPIKIEGGSGGPVRVVAVVPGR